MSDITPSMRANNVMSLFLLQEHGFTANTVIDIGAAEGAFFVFRHRAGLFPTARHFFVDAMQENEPGYRKLATKFNADYEITALSCMDGEVVMRIDPDFYNTHVDHLQPATSYEMSRRVPVCTLDRLVERRDLEPPYVLKLDVQGGELDVLRGALRTLDEAVIVTSEIQIFPGRDSLTDLLSFMQGMGWALYDITNLAYYPSDSTFYQCYATFIPKSMDFRKNSTWCAPEQLGEVMKGLQERRASSLRAIDELAAEAPSAPI
jgi:FkbM family methyltransferase